jgi:hypothetical protein
VLFLYYEVSGLHPYAIRVRMKGRDSMKKLSILTITVAFFLILGGQVVAKPTQPTFGSFVNASGVPVGSVLVLNITHKVINDEDSGNVGYWALDNYNKHVQVWQTPDGTFYVVARYTGNWKTFAGALSPGDGVLQSKDASGTFEGGYTATFTGTFDPGTNKTNGNIGTFDYAGTEADVLLGTYGNGQTGPTTPVSFLDVYFTGVSDFTYVNWGWTYHYRRQTWNNFSYGTTGDIVR